MTWVCHECRGHRKRKFPSQDEDSDLDDHLGQMDEDTQQQIQMGLVVRTADPTLLGVDGMQDTMLSCDALREYLEAMLANYRELSRDHRTHTMSQILAHLEVSALTDDQLRKYATTCVGRLAQGMFMATTLLERR